jgi:hypothetical protein
MYYLVCLTTVPKLVIFFANCVLMGGKVENIKDCT